jgi:hypothetical protein
VCVITTPITIFARYRACCMGRAAAAPPVAVQNLEADIVVSHHNFHRPLSRTLDDTQSGPTSPLSDTTRDAPTDRLILPTRLRFLSFEMTNVREGQPLGPPSSAAVLPVLHMRRRSVAITCIATERHHNAIMFHLADSMRRPPRPPPPSSVRSASMSCVVGGCDRYEC